MVVEHPYSVVLLVYWMYQSGIGEIVSVWVYQLEPRVAPIRITPTIIIANGTITPRPDVMPHPDAFTI
jgi:hypothetical protein